MDAGGVDCLGRNHECVRYAWSDLYVMFPRAPDMRDNPVLEDISAMQRRTGRPVSMVVFVQQDTPRPSERSRQEAADDMERLAPLLTSACTLIVGQGFFAGFFISMTGQMMRMQPTATPRTLCRDIPAAAKFCAKHSPRMGATSAEAALRWIQSDASASDGVRHAGASQPPAVGP